jgi:uncharacterized protein
MSYQILPFRYRHLNDHILLVNDVGDYQLLNKDVFKQFTTKTLSKNSEIYFNLQAKGMLCQDNIAQTINWLATRYRTKKRYLYEFTSLHMFVVTIRCNQKCSYCHASSVGDTKEINYDMDAETARKCTELVMQSPSKHIKIEFQGGEPTLNFKVIREIVLLSKKLNENLHKNLEYVICTNLLSITDEQLTFLREHNICISTSLDGPEKIHDSCRKNRQGEGTYRRVIGNISRAKDKLGSDMVSALMTITPNSLHNLNEVIDEYIEKGFKSIFLRMINPYGRVMQNWDQLGYSVTDFLKAYTEALEYIITINLSGVFFVEEFAALLLAKILTPFSTGFVDLQSPSGAGISGAIYETNGDVFVADEGRMLVRMSDDKTFCLGNAHYNTWEEMVCGEKLKKIVGDSLIESSPGCSWCAYQPYCGSDPVRNYIEHGDFTPRGLHSDFCKKHMGIFDLLFNYLKSRDEFIENVFWSWVTNRHPGEVELV